MHTAGLLQPTKQPHVLDRAWATALQHVVRALGHDLVLGSVPFMTAFIESIHCVRSGSVSMFGFAGSSSSVSGLAVEYSIQ
jgi:hypothetical protein